MKRNVAVWIIAFAGSWLMCFSCDAKGKRPDEAMQMGSYTQVMDKKVSDFLGAGRIAVLSAADKVEVYQIDWARKSGKSAMTVQGYPVVSRGRDLSDRQITAVRAIIAAASSYEFQWTKRTRLRPSYLLRFIRGNDTVDIAMDFNSRQWGFYHRGKLIEEDISENSAHPALWGIIRSLFN
ncbi:hypothetical protein QUF72_18205 [Desulfobacterales bacterium HSG2]|nr:hypothetical protein [Desulfobacterales bacterium HSG2]